jgi:cytochrome c peroxidase
VARPAPTPPASSYDHAAAARGKKIFNGQGRCTNCHMPPIYTDAGYNAHKPSEICTDAFQANRGPDGTYVTPQLPGLWARSKRGFYHDGRYANLGAVVEHYNSCFGLGLNAQKKSDLVQFLKSL